MIRIESLLSARLFMSPQRVGERLFFVSNLSGRLSLVADLSAKGKEVDILLFQDEGHDVLKYENRVRCDHGFLRATA